MLFADAAPDTGRPNYLRFRLSPNPAIAIAARVKLAGKEFVGDQRELYLSEERTEEESPYERLLGDAMIGDDALFAREDAVVAAWAVVDPVLPQKRQRRSSDQMAPGTTPGSGRHPQFEAGSTIGGLLKA